MVIDIIVLSVKYPIIKKSSINVRKIDVVESAIPLIQQLG
jgi:hypothetical protein